MADSAPQLRPLGVGDLLDETFRLYRRHFRLLAGIAATLWIPFGVIQLTAQISVQAERTAITAGIVAVIIVIISIVLSLAMYAPMTYAVSEVYLGRRTSIRRSYAAGLGRWGPLLGVTIIYLLAVGAMAITVVGIPFAIYFSLAWIFCYQTLVLEGVGMRAALGRSRALVRGRWWRVFGILLLIGIFQLVVMMIVAFPSGIIVFVAALARDSAQLAVVATVVQVLTGVVNQILISPFMTIAWTLLYYDLRVRNEGFDLELMAQSLDLLPASGGVGE